MAEPLQLFLSARRAPTGSGDQLPAHAGPCAAAQLRNTLAGSVPTRDGTGCSGRRGGPGAGLEAAATLAFYQPGHAAFALPNRFDSHCARDERRALRRYRAGGRFDRVISETWRNRLGSGTVGFL